MTLKANWIENNLEKMMGQILSDARRAKPLPLSIRLHGAAYNKFISILRSQNAFFPDPDGKFKFLGVPVYCGNHLPYGTFVVERFKGVSLLDKK